MFESFLEAVQNPIFYSLIFFIFAILTVIILPIPVEIGLFNPFIHPLILITLLALGKGVGSLIVFHITSLIKNQFHFTKMDNFLKRYKYYGIFIVMSIPLMLDSIPLYFFSLLKPERRKFVLVNILAGAVRGTIIIGISYAIGVRLV